MGLIDKMVGAQIARAFELDASAELTGTLDVLAPTDRPATPLSNLKLSTLKKREQTLARDLRSVRQRIRDVERRRAAFDQHFDVVGE